MTWGKPLGKLVPLPVTAIALLIVLDRLDIRDAAVCTSRSSARGLICSRVTTAVLVHDLSAHAGESRRVRRVARRGAPSAGGAEGRGRGRRGCRVDALIGRAAGQLLRGSSQTEGALVELRQTMRSAARRDEAQSAGSRRAGAPGKASGRRWDGSWGFHEGQAGCGAVVQVARQLNVQPSSDKRSVLERVVGAFQRGQLGQQESFIRQTSQRAGLTVPLERC